MPYKINTNTNPGDSSHFGPDDINKFSKYLSSVDLSATDPADIATQTFFRSSKLQIRDPSNTRSVIIAATDGNGADRTVTFPVLNSNQNIVTTNAAQTLTNKTMDYNSNTFINFPAGGGGAGDMILANIQTVTGAKTFNDTKLLLRNPADTFSVTLAAGAQTAARTFTFPVTSSDTIQTVAATQTPTNKTINATNNTITDTSTALGDVLKSDGTKFSRFAKGTANQVLAVNGTGTDLTWVANAAGASTSAANTWTAIQTFNDTDFALRNPANTFSATVSAGAQTAARTFTFPVTAGNDTIQTIAATQTVTNKTFNVDQNTVKDSTTNAAGDILKSDGTKYNRLARGTANQLLTVNGAGTDVVWATASGVTDVNAAHTNSNNAFGAFYEDISQIAAPANPSAGTRRLYMDSTTGKLSVRTSAGTSLSLEEQGSGGGSWQGYDYYVFIDTTDLNKIKAKNGTTGAIDFVSTNDAAAVINSCITTLQPETLNYQLSQSQYPAGKIVLGPGVFPVRTTIIIKSRVQIQGAGYNSTILRLDNSINTTGAFQIFRSYTYNALVGTNTANQGDRDVILKDFAIDGNKANNVGGTCVGIRKYGHMWTFDHVHVHHCTSHGIESEWSGTASSVDYNAAAPNGSDQYMFYDVITLCAIWENGGRGVFWRGPNNSYIFGTVIWLNGEEGIYAWSNTASGFDGTFFLNMCHTFYNGTNHAQGSALTPEYYCITYSRVTDCIFETAYNGWCIKVGDPTNSLPGWIDGSNIEIYNPITGGIWLTNWAYPSSMESINLHLFGAGWGAISNNAIALLIESNDHYISGAIHDFANTGQVGMKVGSATFPVSGNVISLKMYNNTTSIVWGDGSTNQGYNIVEADIRTDSVSQTAVSGSVNLETNRFRINSRGSGTLWPWGDTSMIYYGGAVPRGGTSPNPEGFRTEYIVGVGWKNTPYYGTDTATNIVSADAQQTLTKKVIQFADPSVDRIKLAGTNNFGQSGGTFSPVTGSAVSFDVMPTQAVNTNAPGGIFRIWANNDTSNYELAECWYTGTAGWNFGTNLAGTATPKPFNIRSNGVNMITFNGAATIIDHNSKTLNNSVITVDQNTLKHSTTNSAGDILKSDGTKMVRLGRGTANQVLAVNAGGTDIAWATLSGTTDPTALTVVQDPILKRTGYIVPVPAATVNNAGIFNIAGALAGSVSVTGAGTPTQTLDSTEGLFGTALTSTTANNKAGIVPVATTAGLVNSSIAGKVRARIKMSSSTSSRFVFILSSNSNMTLNGTNDDTPLQPAGTGAHGIGVYYPAASGGYQSISNNGSGPGTNTALSGTPAKDAAWHTIEINWPAGMASFNVVFDGTTTAVNNGGDMPASNTPLYLYCMAENSSTTAIGLACSGIWFETTR